MRLLVFVPAHNEEENIKRAVENLRSRCPGYDYLVIDDGSTDRTAAICRDLGYPCVSLPVNLGLDGVFQTGMRYAYEKGYDAAVPFDGDGQHNAEYLPPLLEKLEEGYDIVVGSRFLEKKKGGSLRMTGSLIISFFFRLTTGVTFTDPTSGLRMVRRNVMKRIATDPNCGAEPDTWAYFVKRGARLAEVQVEMNERAGGTSYFTLGRAIFFMLRMCISMMFIQPFRKEGEI